MERYDLEHPIDDMPPSISPSGSKIDQYFKGFKKVKWGDFDNVDVGSFRESTGSSYRRSYFGL